MTIDSLSDGHFFPINASGSQVAMAGNTVISAIAATSMKKNGIEAFAT